jgi:hypothetical protein
MQRIASLSLEYLLNVSPGETQLPQDKPDILWREFTLTHQNWGAPLSFLYYPLKNGVTGSPLPDKDSAMPLQQAHKLPA